MASVAEIASAMKGLLSETAQRLGRETTFVQRASKLDGAGFAQSWVVGWLEHPDASLSQLSQSAASMGVAISPQGLDQRFDQEAATFLRQLWEEAARRVLSADPRVRPVLSRFSAVPVQDSTTITLPNGLAAVWQGGGDASGQPLAALKVHVRIDLLRGTLHDRVLAPGRTSDRTRAAAAESLPPDALAIADLGYFAVARLAQIAQRSAYFLSRLQLATAVFDDRGQRLVLEEVLGPESALQVEQLVTIGAQERLPVRLLAVRVSQEIADQRRRRLKAEARRQGKTLPPRQLVLADWSLLVTNASSAKLSLTEAFALMRVRWQIELLFKLGKSHAHLAVWRTANDWRILCEVYAKLLGVLLHHWLIGASCWTFPDRSLVKAAVTIRAHALLIADALRGSLDLVLVLELLHQTLQACPRLERRVKHPATFQLLEDLARVA